MKIYNKEHIPIIKIDITQQGCMREFVKIHQTSFNDAFDFIYKLAVKYGSSIKKGRTTSVRVREYVAGKVVEGRNKQTSFYGLTPKEFREIIIETLEQN